MNDNFNSKLEALFAAARAAAPDTSRAEYGFETRLAARLRAENGGSLFAWAWRLCPFFAAVALAVGWWSQTTQRADVVSPLAAETAPANDEQLLVAYMTGGGDR
jgi:hypothetical protein